MIAVVCIIVCVMRTFIVETQKQACFFLSDADFAQHLPVKSTTEKHALFCV